jgi:hypothetical protein
VHAPHGLAAKDLHFVRCQNIRHAVILSSGSTKTLGHAFVGFALCKYFLASICFCVGWVEVRNPTMLSGLNPTYKKLPQRILEINAGQPIHECAGRAARAGPRCYVALYAGWLCSITRRL